MLPALAPPVDREPAVLRQPPAAVRLWHALERMLDRAAQHRRACIVLAGVLPVLVRLLLLPWFPPPLAMVPDEFAHVLVGQTFAEGRVTNPTHPLWQHFESLFILQQPTYTGKYQPGYGATLALGIRLAGHPWAGIVLTEGLMLSGLCWLMFLWLPRRWALLGTTLAIAQMGPGSYWANCYLAVPTTAIGGTLILGAIRLVREQVRARDVALGAAGMALLVYTRPYDAVLMGLVFAAMLVRHLPRHWLRVCVPLALILLPMLGLVLWYNQQVTGVATKLPYSAAREQYGVPQTFFWQAPIRHEEFRHAELRQVYEGQLTMHEYRNSVGNMAALYISRLVILWREYYHVGWLPLLLLFPVALLRVRSTRLLAYALGVVVAGQCLYFYFAGHYIAPMYGAVVILMVQALRILRSWRPAGTVLALGVVAAIWGTAVIPLIGLPLHSAAPFVPVVDQSWTHNPERAAIADKLNSMTEPQLVIVRYGPAHQTLYEYVYNEPRIDQSHVVWARDMGAERNAELLRYYPHRTAWLLEPDAVPFRLTPYH